MFGKNFFRELGKVEGKKAEVKNSPCPFVTPAPLPHYPPASFIADRPVKYIE